MLLNPIDIAVLAATLLSIVGYGVWKTRKNDNLNDYLRGGNSMKWATIGLSVMATQASAITFLSTPGQAWESGMGFIQNYLGMPLALIVVSAFFIPMYYKLKVYTAYEFLENRFDLKTRLLGAILFLIQRGLAAGITIYAPAIILSTVLGWNLSLTILVVGILVIIYTVSGGAKAVGITQKHQMAVIMTGMGAAFWFLLDGMPETVGFTDALHIGAALGKTDAVDLSFNLNERYNVWSGIIGGLFLSLSYFGTDQSQVARYLTGTNIKESRVGMMFNAVLKIPMQFFILLTGVMVFVFYIFSPGPYYFKQAGLDQLATTAEGKNIIDSFDSQWKQLHAEREKASLTYLQAIQLADDALISQTKADLQLAETNVIELRNAVKQQLLQADEDYETKDSDYVFIRFILEHLPTGFVGLLLAVIFSAAMSSTSSELNALGSTSCVDIYHRLFNKESTDASKVLAGKLFTLLWGVIAIGFALYANLLENLIEAVNILGSIFYGVILGIFLVAFFFKKVAGNAVFVGALLSQSLVLILFFTVDIGYLWYNAIGCFGVIIISSILQLFNKDNANALPIFES
jgi:Na+/proline symporter